MKAVRRFTVRAGLPEALAELGTLATNLRWTWHPPTQDLFAAIDPRIWDRLGDPLRLLAEVPAEPAGGAGRPTRSSWPERPSCPTTCGAT